MNKELGKITQAYFGYGGYQDSMIGLSLTFEGKSGWGCGHFVGDWSTNAITWSKSCKWTEADRDKNFAKTVREIDTILDKAKVDCVEKLVGIPVEATFEGNTLKDWRILEEVL